LTGEPITYPRINEAIGLFHERGISTFMVTNAQYAEQLRSLAPVTQLYLSLDAPDKALLKRVDVPLFADYWERLLASLDGLKRKRGRTAIRLTMIKGVNMIGAQGYADLIRRGDPDFVEVKGYMFVGASRQRLSLANMPFHEDVVAFAKGELLPLLPGYGLACEHRPSRVVLLAKEKYFDGGKWETWIDFGRFFELYGQYAAERAGFAGDDYSVRFTRHGAPRAAVVDESTDERDLD
jgi:tRNA wybutosine-synthesizing protein 1